MKFIKFTSLSLLVAILAISLFIGYKYKQYEAKQDEVRLFQKLAFDAMQSRMIAQNEKAKDLYEKAIAIYDKEPKSLEGLAAIYRNEKRYKEAKNLYLKIFEIDSGNYSMLYNVALCEYLDNDFNASIATLEKLLLLDDAKKNYIRLLSANFAKTNQMQKALSYYASIKNAVAKDDVFLKDVIEAYGNNEVLATSFEFDYEKTDDIALLESIMQKYLKQNLDIKALRTAQKILKFNENHQDANKQATILYDKYNQSKMAFYHSQKVKDKDDVILEIYAKGLRTNGEFAKSIEIYDKLYKKTKKSDFLRLKALMALSIKDDELFNKSVLELENADPLLANKFIYALETEAGMVHTFWHKLRYVALNELYKIRG